MNRTFLVFKGIGILLLTFGGFWYFGAGSPTGTVKGFCDKLRTGDRNGLKSFLINEPSHIFQKRVSRDQRDDMTSKEGISNANPSGLLELSGPEAPVYSRDRLLSDLVPSFLLDGGFELIRVERVQAKDDSARVTAILGDKRGNRLTYDFLLFKSDIRWKIFMLFPEDGLISEQYRFFLCDSCSDVKSRP